MEVIKKDYVNKTEIIDTKNNEDIKIYENKEQTSYTLGIKLIFQPLDEKQLL